MLSLFRKIYPIIYHGLNYLPIYVLENEVVDMLAETMIWESGYIESLSWRTI